MNAEQVKRRYYNRVLKLKCRRVKKFVDKGNKKEKIYDFQLFDFRIKAIGKPNKRLTQTLLSTKSKIISCYAAIYSFYFK